MIVFEQCAAHRDVAKLGGNEKWSGVVSGFRVCFCAPQQQRLHTPSVAPGAGVQQRGCSSAVSRLQQQLKTSIIRFLFHFISVIVVFVFGGGCGCVIVGASVGSEDEEDGLKLSVLAGSVEGTGAVAALQTLLQRFARRQCHARQLLHPRAGRFPGLGVVTNHLTASNKRERRGVGGGGGREKKKVRKKLKLKPAFFFYS
jgi:hypothetical protein